MWERAIALAQQAGKRETAAIYTAAEAVCEAHSGNRAAAKERARAALELAKGRDVEYAAAFALALVTASLRSPKGSPPTWRNASRKIRRCNSSIFPRCTLFPHSLIGRRQDAVERLQRAVPYDFAMPGTAFFGKFGGLYHRIYTRRGVPGGRTWPGGRG